MSTKPTLGLRLPPTAAARAAVADAFVGGELPASRPPESSVRSTPARGVIVRSDGRRLRRAQLYMPEDVRMELALHCTRENIDESDFVTQLLRERLRVAG